MVRSKTCAAWIAVVILSAFVCMPLSAAKKAEYQPGTWTQDVSQAFDAAKELKRPVLIDFTGSDWCPWCIKLEQEVFAQKEFIQYSRDHLVLLKIDFPRENRQTDEQKKKNEALAQMYKIKGFPTVLVVSHTGNVLLQTGYQPGGAEKYVRYLESKLKKNK